MRCGRDSFAANPSISLPATLSDHTTAYHKRSTGKEGKQYYLIPVRFQAVKIKSDQKSAHLSFGGSVSDLEDCSLFDRARV